MNEEANETFKEWHERLFPKRTLATELVAKTYTDLHRHPFRSLLPHLGGDLEHEEALDETARRTGVDRERVDNIVKTYCI